MRTATKPWYKITYTAYQHWTESELDGNKIPAYTTWEIVDRYTESIRKANKWLKEIPGAKMTIVNR